MDQAWTAAFACALLVGGMRMPLPSAVSPAGALEECANAISQEESPPALTSAGQPAARRRAIRLPPQIGPSTAIDASPIVSGRILFAATGTTDPNGP
jgi:hypothetical protein